MYDMSYLFKHVTDPVIWEALYRFQVKVECNGDPVLSCWSWIGTKTKKGKYAVFWFKGRNWLAHRWIYCVQRGRLTPLWEIDHTCFVTYCVNPLHLEEVTHEENMRRVTEYRAWLASLSRRIQYA